MTDILYKEFGSVVKLEGVFSRADMVILYEPEHFDQVQEQHEYASHHSSSILKMPWLGNTKK